MLAHMYTIKEWDRSIRTTFEIPQDPYDPDDTLADEAKEYLRSLGVFFYRDEENLNGIVLETDDEESIFDKRGFTAYKQLASLKNFTIEPWFDTKSKDALDKIAKEGDDRAWLLFNEEKYVLEVRESSVRCTP